jgi:hypothetical protein
MKCAALAESRQIRQFALFDESFCKLRVHAVKSKNYDALRLGLKISAPAPQKAEELAYGPGQKSKYGLHRGQKQSQEGREDRKARAWTNVSVRGRSKDQKQH